jgi:hypothetical protein
MSTRIHIVLQGTDHVEVQVDDEAAADRVADLPARERSLGGAIIGSTSVIIDVISRASSRRGG